MADAAINKRYIYVRWFFLRLSMIVFDIIAVNAAYYLALVVRFYVNYEFNIWAVKYVPAFFEFAPYYTLCALAVFGLTGLYNSLWKYASLSDMNRIICASLITALIHILGTLFFVMRMPITYYALGAAFQFVFITASRFSYRILTIEVDRFSRNRKHHVMNVMIVGLSESSHAVIKHLERDPDSIAKPVCMIDTSSAGFKGTMAGVPVLGGTAKIPDAVRKYQVDRVLLADTMISPEARKAVKEVCHALDIPVQDFSGFFQSAPSRIPLPSLLEYVEGPVLLELANQQIRFESARKAAAEINEKYIVSAVSMKEDTLCIRVIQDVLRPNDTQADWVQAYEQETGEDISFF